MTTHNQGGSSLTRREFVIGAVGGGTAGLVAAAGEKPSAQTFLAGSDWPMYRRDPALSAHHPQCY